MRKIFDKIKSNFSLKLALGFAAFSVLGLIIVFVTVNSVVRDTIYDNVVGIARHEQSDHADEIDAWFGTAVQLMDNLANVLRAMESDRYYASVAERFVEEYDFVDNIFVGFPDGRTVNGLRWVPDEDWSLFDRPWYAAARAADGELAVLDAFWSHSGQVVAVALSKWIPDAGEDGLILGFSITLDYVLNRVGERPVMGDGHAFLIGANGQIITFPEPYFALGPEMNVFNLRYDIEGGGVIMDKIDTGVLFAQVDDARAGPSYLIAAPLENVDWTLISLIPLEATEAIIQENLTVIMTAFSVILIILFAVVMFFVSKLTRSEEDSRANLREAQRELEAVERIKAAETFTQALLDNSPAFIEFWDADLNFVSCNRQALDFFGVESQEEYQRRYYEFQPEYQPCGTLSKEKTITYVNQALEEGYAKFEFMHMSSAGEMLPVETTIVRLSLPQTMLVCYNHDLRKIKEAADREREANELNEIFMQNAPLVMNIWDDTISLIATNPQSVEMFELENTQQYIDRFFDLSPEYQPCGTSSRDKALMYNNRAFAEGYVRFEWMHQKLNGEQLPCEIILSRFMRLGRPYLAAFAIDLRPAKAMRQMEAEHAATIRMQAMLNASPLACFILNANFEVTELNRESVRLFEAKDKQDFIDNFFKAMPEYQPDGESSAGKMQVMMASDEESVGLEWIAQTFNGEPFPCEVHASQFIFSGAKTAIVHIRDLRASKQAEHAVAMSREALEHREKLLYTVSQVAQVLLTVTDSDGLDYALEQSMSMLCDCLQADRVRLWRVNAKEGGFRVNIFVEHAARDMDSAANDAIRDIPPGMWRKWEKQFLRGEYINGPVTDMTPEEQELLNPGGAIKSLFIIPISLSGRLWGFFSIDDCVNERIISNEELDIMRSASLMIVNTCHRVEQEAEMWRIEVAERESKAKSRFLAQVSHEIRTPLNAIIGVTEIQLQSITDTETEDALLRIHNSSHMLLTLINNLLDLSKAEADKMEIIDRSYELAGLVYDVVQMNTIYIGSKQITFKLRVDPELPARLTGDALRVKQICNNVLSNAFKYTEKGEVSLAVGFEAAPQDDSVVLVIRVSDTGKGMTKEQIKRLFSEEYIRFDEDESASVQGTGLGLAIMYRLIKMMDGGIEVESEPGKGTSITMRLPQKKADNLVIGKEAAENLQSFEAAKMTSKKIRRREVAYEPMPYGRVLVVDDTESNLYVAKGLLSPYGLLVDTAESGVKTIEKVKAGEVYDIIFMDHMMPDMDGIETVKILREMGYAMPVVALTANALVGQNEIFLQNGFQGFISKPIDMRHLNACLEQFIRDKQPPEVISAAKHAAQMSFISENQQSAPNTGGGPGRLAAPFLRDANRASAILESIIGKDVFDAGSLKKYTTQVHSMKSALRSIGESAAADIAADLEEAGMKGNTELIKAQTSVFLASLKTITERLSRETSDSAETNTTEQPADLEFIRRQLTTIEESCESYDLYAANTALNAITQKPCPQNIRTIIDEISICLLHSDFTKAVELARTALERAE